jgi:hypothetical protein
MHVNHVNTEDVRKVLSLAGLPRAKLKTYERQLREAEVYPSSAPGGGGVGRARVELPQALRLLLAVLASGTTGQPLVEAVELYANLAVKFVHYTFLGSPVRAELAALGFGMYSAHTFGELLETLVTEERGPFPIFLGVSRVEPDRLEAFVNVVQPTARGLPLACSLVATNVDAPRSLEALERRRMVGGHVLAALRHLYDIPPKMPQVQQEIPAHVRATEHVREAREARARGVNGAGHPGTRGVHPGLTAPNTSSGSDVSG